MRKLILTTAAVAAAMAGAFAAETAFGTFTDTRDGQTYKTVMIGKQTWMAQNLNYKTKSGSWCYKDSTSYCKKYGRLYDWKTAKKICPTGYHLPSRREWNDLGKAVEGEGTIIRDVGDNNLYVFWDNAGKRLKAKSDWSDNGNGTDNYGFSALPSGYRTSDGGFYGGAGYYGGWWTATEYYNGHAYRRDMEFGHDGVNEDNDSTAYGFSVRCVKDSK
jgi:uncharacterized protein (TIGR02145 family)